ncbi:hypothetical protein I5S53_02430 [Pseudomonas juntendi]|uniref:hypothetical protein n=1 Tax=Pseudomonas TaxID=286 RepID=UPI00126924BB|nr:MULTISPECIES: hypothetical protein [Pseudomonas]MBH3382835.1 hypothetical protein [Pseudomonas juntendi]
MARSHALLKYKKAQFVLSQVLNDLAESESNDPNYHLDMDFDRELNALLKRYGYAPQQAIGIIKRQTIVQESLATAPRGALAQVYAENSSSRRSRRNRADQKSPHFLD